VIESRASWDYKSASVAQASETSIVDQGEAGNDLAQLLRDAVIDVPHAGDSWSDYERVSKATTNIPDMFNYRIAPKFGALKARYSSRNCLLLSNCEPPGMCFFRPLQSCNFAREIARQKQNRSSNC
jgi:hypothetical protein